MTRPLTGRAVLFWVVGFFAVIIAAWTVACSGAVEQPPAQEDAGADADRSQCDWSILDCDDAHEPACLEALAAVTCDAPIPDACKPCIRSL